MACVFVRTNRLPSVTIEFVMKEKQKQINDKMPEFIYGNIVYNQISNKIND